MEFIFLNNASGEQLTMPVTPADYSLIQGRQVEGIDMALTGQLHVPGNHTLFNERLTFLLPAEARSYTGAGWSGQPYNVVDKLVEWSRKGAVLRLIVTQTPINVPVLLGPVQYGEQDGTGDVTVVLEVREYRQLGQAQTVNAGAGNQPRQDETPPAPTAKSHTVVAGDNLWTICQTYYGDGSLAYKLAAANGIKNANLIYPKQVLTIPPRDQL